MQKQKTSDNQIDQSNLHCDVVGGIVTCCLLIDKGGGGMMGGATGTVKLRRFGFDGRRSAR